MPSYTRMKTIFLRSLLWLYLLGIGCVVLSVEPGYLDFDNLPDTNFSCVGKVIGGYYADLETNCQMFHVCTIGQLDEPMDIRFLCLNGTVFDQETRVCERIDEVDCTKSEKFYSLNLELYGNTQPSISEDNAETDPPIIIRASTTTTTTTTTQKPKPKTTKATYFTTPTPAVTTVTKVISAHHFPISNNADIRFNPEEINISLNPGSPPNVRSKTVSYQHQVFSSNNNNKKVVVTTHTSYGTPEKEDFVRVVPNTQRPHLASTQKIQPQSPATPADINYGFTYHQTESGNQDYTETPHNYQYQRSNLPFRHGQFRNQFKTTTYRTEHLPTTRKNTYIPKEPTTFRAPYVSSLKTPTYHTYRTEKPQRLQLPIPLLPTLPPLTFSSPAPFTLGNHIETKRYTSEHQTPPRIIISASASVSDNSGRRLNYSLGTIGVTPLLEKPPKSYDDYKDHDVVLDPFYQDVPKIKSSRQKRQTNANSDQAAVDVLKFLFDWYKNHQQISSTVKVPIDPEDITEINQELAPIVEIPNLENNTKTEQESQTFKDSALFNRQSKFNIIGDILSVTEASQIVTTSAPKPATALNLDTIDYVDDNYEAVLQANSSQIKEEDIQTTEQTTQKEVEVTTLPPTTTTTEPTTTSRIMAIMRSRARAHHKRIMKENRDKYTNYLTNIKPKIRSRGRGRGRSTTEAQKVEETTSTVILSDRSFEMSTTEAATQTLLTTATYPTTTLSENKETVALEEKPTEEQKGEETQSVFGTSQTWDEATTPSQTSKETTALYVESDDQVKEASRGIEIEATTFPIQTLEEELPQNDTNNPQKESVTNETSLESDDLDLLNQQEYETTTEEMEVSPESDVLESPEESLTSPLTEQSQSEHTKEHEVKTIDESQDQELARNVTEIGQNEEITDNEEDEGNDNLQATSEVPKNETQPTDEAVDMLTTEHSTDEFDLEYKNTETTRPQENNNDKDATTTELALVSDDDEQNDDNATSVNDTEEGTFSPSISADDTTLVNEGNTEKLLDTTSTTTEETPAAESLGVTDSSTILDTQPTPETETTALNLTPAEVTTTETVSVSRSRNPRRRTRPPRTRTSSSYRRPNPRHRFSSTEVTSRPSRRKPVIEEEIIDTLTNQVTTTEEIYSTSPNIPTTTTVDFYEDVPTTDAPLFKSANPTQAESSKESLHTTPLSMSYKLHVRKEKLRSYIFNCFGKPINKFYSDPRDCRLFHYCTSGYNKNQLLDMKFVCDLGTFFDDEKLICTKTKPERCL